MTPEQVKLLMIAIILIFYAFNTILTILNLKYGKTELPGELRDVYDAEKYARAQQYHTANAKFSLITSTFGTLLTVLMLYFDGFACIDRLAHRITSNPVMVSLVFFAIIYYAYDLITLPFQIYDTFVIEEKFGFNRTTVKTFITDKLKSWLLTAIIGGLLLGVLVWIYIKTGRYFWLLALGVIAVFQIFLAMFYTDLIVPLFNKLSPLPEGELRQRLEKYAQKVNYKLKNIFVIDSSKRSTKLNAFFSGLGPKKKIVLYDTLIEKLTPEEIEAVLAHETGHYKYRHTLIQTLLALLTTGFFLYLFQVFSHSTLLANALGVEKPSFHIALIALGILYTPLEFFLGIFTHMLSRHFERQADRFAATTSDARQLASGLKKLSAENLSNLTPHPLYVFFYYTHPPLLERLRRLNEMTKQQDNGNTVQTDF